MIAESKAQNHRFDSNAATWRIQSSSPNVAGQIAAFWRYRRLLWTFSVSALQNVYRKAILGIGWSVIQALAISLTTAFVVGRVFNISVEPLPLPLFILVGIAGWTFFRRTLQWVTKSMTSARSILGRIYVPPLLLLVAAASPGAFQFLVVLGVVAMAALYYGPIEGIYYIALVPNILALVPALLLIFLLAIGVGCFTAILNAFAHDTWLTLRYVLSGWMLATPVFYPIEMIQPDFRWLAYLNPLTSALELLRWALLGYGAVQWQYLGLASVEILLLLICGIWFFARKQVLIFDHL